ncbi:hypothetical protein ACJMK2_030677 [Sinanodonta woodiana]|uniref:Uncharacterized protein n=1 Tax=Sinanodonta woodiana TaxID=1069815 RepID=A0ABD3WWG0_SINWO
MEVALPGKDSEHSVVASNALTLPLHRAVSFRANLYHLEPIKPSLTARAFVQFMFAIQMEVAVWWNIGEAVNPKLATCSNELKYKSQQRNKHLKD